MVKRKWDVLSNELASAGADPSRIGYRTLAKRYYKGCAGMCETDETPVAIKAYVAQWGTVSDEWAEVDPIWVREEDRANGVLTEAFGQLVHHTPERVGLFLITEDAVVMRAAIANDFFVATRGTFATVESWAASLGIEDRLPETALVAAVDFEPQSGQEWLLMRY